MRICVGGKNNIAVDVCHYLLEHFSSDVISVIPTKGDDGKDGFQRSLRKYAKERDIQIVSLEKIYEWDDLIFLSTEFDRIIRPEEFKSKELFNIHFSLLPQYKGCHTAAMPILKGEVLTGVTLHMMDSGIDTGDIIEQRKLLIDPNDTCRSLYLKLIDLGTKTVIENIDRIIAKGFNTYPQPYDNSTYFTRTDIDYANIRIDLNRTAKQIDRQIRAYSFRDFQMPCYEGKPIFYTEITNDKSVDKPGTLICEDDYLFRLATIDYDILLYKDRLAEIISFVRDGKIEELKKIKNLSRYIDEHEPTHGWTLLMIAAYHCQYEVVEYLTYLGSNINAINNQGTTVIMFAKNGYLEHQNDCVIRYLLKKGANPYQRDYAGLCLYDYTDKLDKRITEKIKNLI